MRWIRDCGSVLAVGGASVALTLTLGGLPMRQDVRAAFMAVECVVLMTLIVLTGRLNNTTTAPTNALFVLVFVLLVVSVLGVFFPATHSKGDVFGHGPPIEPHTPGWWVTVSVSGAVAGLGIAFRSVAEGILDDR